MKNQDLHANRSLQFESYYDAEGVYRWKSNDAPLFAEDARAHAEADGLVIFDAKVHGAERSTADGVAIFRPAVQDQARRVYTAAIVADLRQREAVEPSEEEMFEMSAAFGKGVEVVNVLTGRRTVTR